MRWRIGVLGYGLGAILGAMVLAICAHGALRPAPIEWAEDDPETLAELDQFARDWRLVRRGRSGAGAVDPASGTRVLEVRRKRFGWRYHAVLIVGPGDRIRHIAVTSKSKILRMEFNRTYALDADEPEATASPVEPSAPPARLAVADDGAPMSQIDDDAIDRAELLARSPLVVLAQRSGEARTEPQSQFAPLERHTTWYPYRVERVLHGAEPGVAAEAVIEVRDPHEELLGRLDYNREVEGRSRSPVVQRYAGAADLAAVEAVILYLRPVAVGRAELAVTGAVEPAATLDALQPLLGRTSED